MLHVAFLFVLFFIGFRFVCGFREMDKDKGSTSDVRNQPTNQPGSTTTSFADMFKDKTPKKTVKISMMRNEQCLAGANVTIPLDAVNEVHSRFANTLYGYFIGRRLAFPEV